MKHSCSSDNRSKNVASSRGNAKVYSNKTNRNWSVGSSYISRNKNVRRSYSRDSNYGNNNCKNVRRNSCSDSRSRNVFNHRGSRSRKEASHQSCKDYRGSPEQLEVRIDCVTKGERLLFQIQVPESASPLFRL